MFYWKNVFAPYFLYISSFNLNFLTISKIIIIMIKVIYKIHEKNFSRYIKKETCISLFAEDMPQECRECYIRCWKLKDHNATNLLIKAKPSSLNQLIEFSATSSLWNQAPCNEKDAYRRLSDRILYINTMLKAFIM